MPEIIKKDPIEYYMDNQITGSEYQQLVRLQTGEDYMPAHSSRALVRYRAGLIGLDQYTKEINAEAEIIAELDSLIRMSRLAILES
jgi:hypothetical protein